MCLNLKKRNDIRKNIMVDCSHGNSQKIYTNQSKVLKDIISHRDIIFIAINDANEAIGFVQLYETFGSLDLGKIIILYDLYVKEDHRKNNIGRQLMIRSHEYAKKINAKRIQLSTATDNFIGQSLYESLGYVKDIDFYTYDFEIK